AAIFLHEGESSAGERDERVGADVVRDGKGLARGIDELAGEGLAGREGDAVEEEVDSVGAFGDFGEEGGDLVVRGDIAGENRGLGAEGGGEFLDVVLQTLALVIEDESGASLMPGLGDGPG